MKMFLIVYAREADEAVSAVLKGAGVRGYTKMVEARGEGTETAPKLATHVWPGSNHVLLVAVANEATARLEAALRELKREHPRAGLRGFLLPLEEMVI